MASPTGDVSPVPFYARFTFQLLIFYNINCKKYVIGAPRPRLNGMILQDWWYTTLLGTSMPIEPPLKGDVTTDIAIVGGGAAGLAAALRLMDSGKRVVLVERNICGGSSTGRSAGFLTPDSELELSQLMRRFGVEGAKDLWGVPVKGIDIMLSAIAKFGIGCDLVKQDSLFLGKGSGGWKDVKSEAESRKRLGFDYTLYDSEEVGEILGSAGYSGAVRYQNTYGVDGLRYAQGMKKVLQDHGVKIFESSEVVSVQGHSLKTHMGTVSADRIIFCADKIKPALSSYSWNVYHAQTFLSVSEPLSDGEVAAMFPSGRFQCWDSDLVYTYFRLTGANRLLVGGGTAWTTYARDDTTSPRVMEQVIHGFREKFPILKDLEFIQYWPGRIDMTRDLLPTVLKVPGAPWIHFVLGCVGLPWATFCGDFVAERVLEEKEVASDARKYYRYFAIDRGFLLPLWAERIFGKRIVFTVNTAWAKYYQVDRNKSIGTSPSDW